MTTLSTAVTRYVVTPLSITPPRCREAEQLMRDEDSSGYDQIFKLMKEAKKNKVPPRPCPTPNPHP